MNARTRTAPVILALALGMSGCAVNTAPKWDRPVDTAALPSTGPVFVMEPIIVPSASPGNVGRDFVAIKTTVATRILSIVNERFPCGLIADSRPLSFAVVARDYQAVLGAPVTPEERDAAGSARQRGATHLLVPTITEWKEMRTDDPIGAVILPHNSVTLTLRLMRLDPPALVGRVTFHNQARLTLNRHAAGLLNDRFRRTVLQLISG